MTISSNPVNFRVVNQKLLPKTVSACVQMSAYLNVTYGIQRLASLTVPQYRKFRTHRPWLTVFLQMELVAFPPRPVQRHLTGTVYAGYCVNMTRDIEMSDLRYSCLSFEHYANGSFNHGVFNLE